MGKSASTILTTLKNIPIDQIKLDLENPRYYEALKDSDMKKWTDKKLMNYIVEEDDILDILGSIKIRGVTDPVWIYEGKKDQYVMVEGSRRLVALRRLQNEKPPKNVSYNIIRAHVYPKNTDLKIMNVQKLILQTGKKKWGPFNEAKAIFDLIYTDRYTVDEVAKNLQKSRGSIEKELENFKCYSHLSKYIKTQKHITTHPRYFSYFQKASIPVRERFFKTQKTRVDFFKLILPNKKGDVKIKSVSLKGGLIKAFNKFSQNEIILKEFIGDPKLTADDALLKYKGGRLTDEFPWIKRLKEVSDGINRLNKDDVKKIKTDAMIFNKVKQIYISSKDFVEEN